MRRRVRCGGRRAPSLGADLQDVVAEDLVLHVRPGALQGGRSHYRPSLSALFLASIREEGCDLPPVRLVELQKCKDRAIMRYSVSRQKEGPKKQIDDAIRLDSGTIGISRDPSQMLTSTAYLCIDTGVRLSRKTMQPNFNKNAIPQRIVGISIPRTP
jgi:hypothetical protein